MKEKYEIDFKINYEGLENELKSIFGKYDKDLAKFIVKNIDFKNIITTTKKELIDEKPLFYTQEDVNRIYQKIQEAKIKLPEISKEELADMWGEKNKSDNYIDFLKNCAIMVLALIVIGLLLLINLS